MNILKKWRLKCLLNVKHEDENMRNICKQIVKDEIQKIKPVRTIRKVEGKKLVIYVNVGKLPREKADIFLGNYKKQIEDFFGVEIFVIPFRSEYEPTSQTRMEYIEV